MNKTKYNYRFIWLLTLVAAMGGFLFGYDWVVVGGAKSFYEPYFNLTSAAQKGWGTSSALTGCMLGALLSFFTSDKWGRKGLLVLAGLLFTFSALGTAWANSFLLYNLFRILGGISIGITLNLSPVYISEMAPPHMRGRLVSINQLLINIGILAAQLINLLISLSDKQISDNPAFEEIKMSWSGQFGWRWMFGAEAVPAILFFILMLLMPQSVRWLVKNGQYDKAKKILSKIGGNDYAISEIKEIKATISQDEISKVHFSDLLEPRLFSVILLGIFLAVLQQWCGMNVTLYYAADIFQAAGYNIKQMMLNITIIGSIMVIMTFITVKIVDKTGRKKLMLLGTAAMAILYGLIGYLFYKEITGMPLVILTLLNVAVYSLTLAPVVWVILSEIFPNRIRGAAMSIAALSLWIGNFTLTFTFPIIKENLGWANNFWLYGLICLAGFVILFYKLPETKNKSLEQIEAELINKPKVKTN
jgi:sugar porter (SP) family MFS transporter